MNSRDLVVVFPFEVSLEDFPSGRGYSGPATKTSSYFVKSITFLIQDDW